ncbi:hypothetical protein D9V30_09350 [Mycetocola reblochoni]|uniref:Thioesterase TesA-like domain-containing protein n=2 Tax=Mycetocola reblochoni TaxID=331618 RepID=A0A3L6ZL88_9MICO|nr:hypothetical protein D9V30_09350 [Mycetocola reblochoni]
MPDSLPFSCSVSRHRRSRPCSVCIPPAVSPGSSPRSCASCPWEWGWSGSRHRCSRGGESAAMDVDELALEYFERIRAIAPRGPYRLAGYSFGGNVAHAIAARLVEEGEEVELLALLDPAPLSGRRDASGTAAFGPEEEAAVRAEQTAFFAELRDEGGDDPDLRAAIRASRGVLGLDDRATVEAIVASHAWASALMAASASPVTAVPTLLFIAGREEPAASGWGMRLGDDTETTVLDADHSGIVAPAAWEQIGPAISRHLEKGR